MIPYYYSVRKAIAVDKNGVRKEEADYERKETDHILSQWQVARRHDVA